MRYALVLTTLAYVRRRGPPRLHVGRDTRDLGTQNS